MMTIAELYPAVQALHHADKLRLMQFLITEFAREEKITLEIPATKQPLDDENLARNFKKAGD
jgi:hypothetical protein